jgi:hypothetical protein
VALAFVGVEGLRAAVVGRARLTAAGLYAIAHLEKLRRPLLLRANAALEDCALESDEDCRDASKLLQTGRVCDATIVPRLNEVWKARGDF